MSLKQWQQCVLIEQNDEGAGRPVSMWDVVNKGCKKPLTLGWWLETSDQDSC